MRSGMRAVVGVVLCSLLPAHAGRAAEWYLLAARPNWTEGIRRYDPVTSSDRILAHFIYAAALIGLSGTLNITSKEDNLVVQGPAFLEFNSVTGQLQRRYQALAADQAKWSFRGMAISDGEAAELSIEPGYYGQVACTVSGDSLGCPPIQVPGFTPRGPDASVLLRRSLDPADTSIAVARTFVPPTDLTSLSRVTTLDPDGRQFWSVQQGTAANGDSVTRLIQASIDTQEESVVNTQTVTPGSPPEDVRTVTSLAFDRPRKSLLFHAWYPFLQESRIIERTDDGTEHLARPVVRDEVVNSITPAATRTPTTYTQLIMAVADTPGANNTQWRSDGWFYNPADKSVELTLERVSKQGTLTRLHLEPGASTKLVNILARLGGGPAGDGTPTDAVIVRSPYHEGAQLSVYTRTFTPSPTGGTYGQAIPAVPTLIGYSNHLITPTSSLTVSDTAATVLLDKREPARFRHNLGIVNTSDAALTITLRYAVISPLPVSDPGRERIVTVPAHAQRQYSIEALFPADVIAGAPPYIVMAGDHPAAIYLSMVDNITGDATFIPFTFMDVEAPREARLAIPGVTHVTGANGTFWRSDLLGVFTNTVTNFPVQQPDANYFSNGCSAATQRLKSAPSFPGGEAAWTNDPFWYTSYPDAASEVCSATESFGALEIRTGSWMSAVARTYTTRPDGGTYGDILPLYPPQGWPARHFAGVEVNEQVRVNIGLYNGTDAPDTITLQLRNVDGATVAEHDVTLAARESFQQSLTTIFGPAVGPGLYALSVRPASGHCWPYVSIVDNTTGDPTNWW